MLDQLREHIAGYLAQHHICIVSTNGSHGSWAMPARYRLLSSTDKRTFDLECLLPTWADLLYHLQHDPHVLLIMIDSLNEEKRWLQYRGVARLELAPDWPAWQRQGLPWVQSTDYYKVIHIAPERIDLIDEDRGWGARETLDF